MKTDAVQQHILKNAHNLRIASAVGEAWLGAKEHLIAGFFERLKSRLATRLKGWTIEPWKRCLIDSDAGYYLWKPAWRDQYYVVLQFGSRGQDMKFGVLRQADRIGKRRFSTELLAAVQKHYPSAHSGKWWEAVVHMHSPAADWTTPEALWKMHTDKEFLVNVAEQLLTVARVSEPIVNRL